MKDGTFKDLSNIWEQEVMIRVVFFTIWNVLVITDDISSLSSDIVTGAGAGAAPLSAEAILDQALHLVMLGIIKRPAGFSLLVAWKKWVSNGKNKTLLEVLWILGEHKSLISPLHPHTLAVLQDKDAVDLNSPDELPLRSLLLEIHYWTLKAFDVAHPSTWVSVRVENKHLDWKFGNV